MSGIVSTEVEELWEVQSRIGVLFAANRIERTSSSTRQRHMPASAMT
jgi:hypothetical protein